MSQPSAGTLLGELDNSPPVFGNNDNDLINRILADMNTPSQSNPVMNVPPPSGNGNRMIQSPNPNSTLPVSMDPATATAHLIGKDYPTAADFANLMQSQGQGQGFSHGGSAFASVAPTPTLQPTLVDTTKGNMYSDLISQIKQPLIVSIIIFVVSLPVINVLIGHYLPSLLRIGGDLTTAGLVVKSLFGGFLFWFLQKVLVPLMVV
jgi:hypothetical protein